jgi:transposase-like protein
MENRHGLLVDACLTLADGHAEWVAALQMIEPRADRPTAITLGADKAYDAEDFVNELRSMNVTPVQFIRTRPTLEIRVRSNVVSMTSSYPKAGILTGPERRRRWSVAEKLEMVAESRQAGITVSLVARRRGISPSQLFTWRRLAEQGALTATQAGEEVVPASALPRPARPDPRVAAASR